MQGLMQPHGHLAGRGRSIVRGPRVLHGCPRLRGWAGIRSHLAGWCAVAVLALTAPVRAHEHRIDLDDFYPAAGSTNAVYVRSGHYFPKSVLTLSEKVMRGLSVRLPDGQARSVVVEAGEHQWEGSLGPLAGGTHVFSFALKRARAAEPNYQGKAILVTGPGSDDPAAYALGAGLELVPQLPVSYLAPGQELPVLLVLDGVPIAGDLAIVPEGGRTTTAKCAPGEPAVVSVRRAGRHLITASVKGRGCSLVFSVREPEETAE